MVMPLASTIWMIITNTIHLCKVTNPKKLLARHKASHPYYLFFVYTSVEGFHHEHCKASSSLLIAQKPWPKKVSSLQLSKENLRIHI